MKIAKILTLLVLIALTLVGCSPGSENDNASTYTREGNTIYFGSYPQSEVTDSTLKATLSDMGGTLPTAANQQGWTSYGYYCYGEVEHFMWYQDIAYNGETYRGVYFTQFRPYQATENKANLTPAGNSQQDENGYLLRGVYWFKFEPIAWTVLSEENGTAFLLCDRIMDAQAYQNEYYYEKKFLYTNYNYFTHSNGAPDGTYANNYAYSTIRTWLNDTFYNTAFNDRQKGIILTTTVDNSTASTESIGYNPYASENTQDKIFLLSCADVTNSAYNVSRKKQITNYALSQGAYDETLPYYDNDAGRWWLRSPHSYEAYYAHGLSNDGHILDYRVDRTDSGVVPALYIQL